MASGRPGRVVEEERESQERQERLERRLRDVKARFRPGDLVELIDGARALKTYTFKLCDGFEASVTYKVYDVCGVCLRFEKDANLSLWRVPSGPGRYPSPCMIGDSCFFQRVTEDPVVPTTEDPVVPTKIAALSTVFAELQSDQVRGLKRKLAETTLAMERGRMECEDFRLGNAPCHNYKLLTWRGCCEVLRHEALEYEEENDELVGEIAVARNALDNFFNDTSNVEPIRKARAVLNDALPG